MKIVENLIEITGPSIKALFLDMVVYSEPTLDKGECRLMGVYDDSPIYITLSQVAPLLEPKEGEWCFQILGAGMVAGIVRYHRTEEVMYSKLGSYIALNPLTLQAEKDGILREMVELCEVVK